MKVDLPAPLGPNRPKIDPLGILRDTESRAKKELLPSGDLYCLLRFLISIALSGSFFFSHNLYISNQNIIVTFTTLNLMS